MTQTAAGHRASEDVGDPEPLGLASSWTEPPPARRALPVEETPYFQATPVRVDEAFPEYEAYHSVIETPAFDSVAADPAVHQPGGWGDTPVVALPPVPRTEEYGWVPGTSTPQREPHVAPGLAPYPMTPTTVSVPQFPAGTYAVPAPVPTADGSAAVPNPYQGMYVQPVPQSFAAPSPYQTQAVDETIPMALVAAGGTFLVLRRVASVLPFVIVSILFTIVAATVGQGAWVLAAFAWLTTAAALFARPLISRRRTGLRL